MLPKFHFQNGKNDDLGRSGLPRVTEDDLDYLITSGQQHAEGSPQGAFVAFSGFGLGNGQP